MLNAIREPVHEKGPTKKARAEARAFSLESVSLAQLAAGTFIRILSRLSA